MDKYVLSVLNTIAAYPTDNDALLLAVGELKAVFESSFQKSVVELINGAKTVAQIVVSDSIDTMWKEAIYTFHKNNSILLQHIELFLFALYNGF